MMPRWANLKIPLEVGDCVRGLSKGAKTSHEEYYVLSLRTGLQYLVPWDTFLPVGAREMCSCYKQMCLCVYADFEKSRALMRQPLQREGSSGLR